MIQNDPETLKESINESPESDNSDDQEVLIQKAMKLAQKAIYDDELNKDSAISQLIDNQIPLNIAEESVNSIITRRHLGYIIVILIGFVLISLGIFLYSYSDKHILKYISDLLVIFGAIVIIDIFIDIIRSKKISKFKKK